jgi:hypothetical protein
MELETVGKKWAGCLGENYLGREGVMLILVFGMWLNINLLQGLPSSIANCQFLISNSYSFNSFFYLIDYKIVIIRVFQLT